MVTLPPFYNYSQGNYYSHSIRYNYNINLFCRLFIRQLQRHKPSVNNDVREFVNFNVIRKCPYIGSIV